MVCIKSVQAPDKPNPSDKPDPSVEMGIGQENPLLVVELLAIVSFWRWREGFLYEGS